MEKLFLSIDLGTSFMKSGVYDLSGRYLAGSTEAVPSECPAPGVFIQRGEQLYSSVCACIRQTVLQLNERSREIEAIAFTGQMVGAIGVDEGWNDVTGWSCSLDSRYLPYAEQQRSAHSDLLFELAGTNAPVMCAKYAWFKNEFPEEHRRIAKYVMLSSYMLGKFSRIPVSEAAMDYSLIAWTGLADIRRRMWSAELCRAFGVEASMLPRIVPGTYVGGYLHTGVASDLGLPSGIPLIIGAGDKVSGCIGANVLNDGDMIFEAASYGAVSCKIPAVRLDSASHSYDVIGGADQTSYYAHKYIQGSGITIDWFVNQFVRKQGMTTEEAFALAEQLAENVPAGSEGLLAIGLLGGSAIPFDSSLRGLFMGHTWVHHCGHFYNALLESLSYELALTLEALAKQYPACTSCDIKLIGGGASSKKWSQLLADVTGHSFTLLHRKDAALWGAALLAAAGTGNLADLQAAAKSSVQIETVYTPDQEKHADYQKYIRTYETFKQELRGFYQKLSAL